jgi:hypothetical protein
MVLSLGVGRFSALFSVLLMTALGACSPQEPGRPNWTSGKDNIAYAVSAICAPYVFDGVDATELPMHQTLVRDDGWRRDYTLTSQKLEAGPVRVGYAGDVHIVVGKAGDGRQCEIAAHPLFAPASMTLADAQGARRPKADHQSLIWELKTAAEDAQVLRAAALAALAKRPESFAPTKSRYAPGRFASEDMLCAASTGAHPGGFVLLSAAGQTGQGTVMLTISDSANRSPSCDREGVQMNYRTLVSDSGK